jgi:hypothetical protein
VLYEAKKLLKKLQNWRESIKADMLIPNLDFDVKQPFKKSVATWKVKTG